VWSGIVKICDEDAYRLRGVSVDKGDVLINITGDSILRTCVVDPGVLPARVNQHVAIIRARENIPARFLHLYLVQPSSKALLLGNDAGGSRPAITKGHLEAFPIILPTPQLLHVFGNITAPLFDLSEQNEAENRTLAQTRDLMLHKLMSGEIRLRTAEKIVGEVA
jgi:type I restriction enzyme S subunit